MSAVEAVARAIAKAAGHSDWDYLPGDEAASIRSIQDGGTAACRDDYLNEARAAIEALAALVSEETVRPLIAELAPAYDAVRNRSTGRDEVIFSQDESVRAAVLAIRAFLRAALSEKP